MQFKTLTFVCLFGVSGCVGAEENLQSVPGPSDFLGAPEDELELEPATNPSMPPPPPPTFTCPANGRTRIVRYTMAAGTMLDGIAARQFNFQAPADRDVYLAVRAVQSTSVELPVELVEGISVSVGVEYEPARISIHPLVDLDNLGPAAARVTDQFATRIEAARSRAYGIVVKPQFWGGDMVVTVSCNNR